MAIDCHVMQPMLRKLRPLKDCAESSYSHGTLCCHEFARHFCVCVRERAGGKKVEVFSRQKFPALQYLYLHNISNYYAIIILHTCARGKVIGHVVVVVVIVDTKIGKFGDLGKVYGGCGALHGIPHHHPNLDSRTLFLSFLLVYCKISCDEFSC